MKRMVASHSQHFLRDSSLIGELVGHSNVRKSDTVIDIGAGSGAITAVLARRVKRVIAYEPEPKAYAVLRKNMAKLQNVEVIERDFLTARLPADRYKVFANIPFHLSSQIVRKLAFSDNPPTAIYLIVQKQFAQKLLTDGHHFHGALGMGIAPWWVARIRRPLRKTDFTPPPAVDTVLLELKPRDVPLLPLAQHESYVSFLADCYADPKQYRKTTAPRDQKPSDLTVEQWVSIYRQAQT